MRTEKPKAELLAPAGSLDILKAVSVAGADAVYAAGGRFGARAYANNFTDEELLYAIDYLHLHGKRLYLTVNTLLKQEELNRELYDYILPLYRQGLDGVIVQDLGVLKLLREHFPGMELHASTQMSITGPYGAALMKELGCCRVVTARELSLTEIRRIHEEVDIEIESFIHGALCYCYSGQCLFSSMLGGRSGNRGRCAQPCRLPYRTKAAGEAYLLSPRDLCTIKLLPQILDNGVYSLKIEGRMKQAEYAAGVTGIYREYLDRCLLYPTEEYRVSEADLKRLTELGSRSGFTGGYYLVQNGPEMMAMEQPAHSKSNEELQKEMRERYLRGEIQEKMNGILTLSKENPACLVLKYKGVEINVTGDVVQKAKSRPMERETIQEKMNKTGGSAFVFDSLEIRMEEDIFIPVGALNQLRREGIAQLEKKLLSEYRRERKEHGGAKQEYQRERKEHGEAKQESENRNSIPSAPYLAVGVQTAEQARLALEYGFVDRIYIDSGAFDREGEAKELQQLAETLHSAGKKLFYVLPPVMRGETISWYEEHLTELEEAKADGFVIGSYEGLGLLKKTVGMQACVGTDIQPETAVGACRNSSEKKSLQLHADSSLYAWSARAAEELFHAGADTLTLPVEANRAELLRRGYPGGELLLYGYLPLMVSAQCVVKNTAGCEKKPGFTRMTDRCNKQFLVKNQCKDCYNVIYNSSPLSLLHQQKAVSELGAEGYRIFFTEETEAQIREVLRLYEQAFLKKQPLDKERYLKDYTNGHFKRGAE